MIDLEEFENQISVADSQDHLDSIWGGGMEALMKIKEEWKRLSDEGNTDPVRLRFMFNSFNDARPVLNAAYFKRQGELQLLADEEEARQFELEGWAP